MSDLDNQTIMNYCRLLGVHPTANKKAIKLARDRIAKIYHPDKNAHIPSHVQEHLAEKFKKIQHAYEFLIEHHDQISERLSTMQEFSLTSKGHKANRSRWVYATVSSYA